MTTKHAIPEAALNQHLAILGKTGSGKTFAAKGIVERLLDEGRQVCVLDPTGGYFSNVTGPLSSRGLIEFGRGTISLTDAGRQFAQPPDHGASLEAYHESLMGMVDGPTRKILVALIAANGEPMTAEQIGKSVGIDHTGGYFSNCIGPLGRLGLVERSRGLVTPTSVLFPEGLS